MCVESVSGRVRTQPILEFDILQRIADLDKKLIRPLLIQVCIVFIVRYWKANNCPEKESSTEFKLKSHIAPATAGELGLFSKHTPASAGEMNSSRYPEYAPVITGEIIYDAPSNNGL
jgi:hypothetical protein